MVKDLLATDIEFVIFLFVQVLCETRWLQDGSPQAASPRYVARKQLESLEELGYKLQSTFELEFSLLDSQTLLPSYSDLDFMSKSTIMRYEKLFSDLSKSVVAGAGIHLETIQTEYSQGQIEITLRYGHKRGGQVSRETGRQTDRQTD